MVQVNFESGSTECQHMTHVARCGVNRAAFLALPESHDTNKFMQSILCTVLHKNHSIKH